MTSGHRIVMECYAADVVLFVSGGEIEHYPAVIAADLLRELRQHRRDVMDVLQASAGLPPCQRCGGQMLCHGTACQCVTCGQAEIMRLAKKRAAREKAINEKYRIEIERGRGK